jgi:DNA-binding LytR/AlgR family response regulator
MLRILVVEDEKASLDQLSKAISLWAGDRVETIVDTAGNALELAGKKGNVSDYDIVFLDIELKGLNGLDIAQKLRDGGYGNMLVFVSNHNSFMQDGYCVNAFRYLLKPASYEELKKCLDRALENHLGDNFRFSIGGEHFILPFREVRYFSSAGHYVTVHGLNKDYTVKMPMKQVLEKLPKNFAQCHQSYIVNISQISKLVGKVLVLRNGEKVDVSSRHLPAIRSVIFDISK